MRFRLTLTLKGLLLPGMALLLTGVLAGCGGGGGGAGTGGMGVGPDPTDPVVPLEPPCSDDSARCQVQLAQYRVLTAQAEADTRRVGSNPAPFQTAITNIQNILDGQGFANAEATLAAAEAALEGAGDDATRERAEAAVMAATEAIEGFIERALTQESNAETQTAQPVGLLFGATIPTATEERQETRTSAVASAFQTATTFVNINSKGGRDPDDRSAPAINPFFAVWYPPRGELSIQAREFAYSYDGSPDRGRTWSRANWDNARPDGNGKYIRRPLGDLGDFHGYDFRIGRNPSQPADRDPYFYLQVYTDRTQDQQDIFPMLSDLSEGVVTLPTSVGDRDQRFRGHYDPDGDGPEEGGDGQFFCQELPCTFERNADDPGGPLTSISGFRFKQDDGPITEDTDYLLIGVWLEVPNISGDPNDAVSWSTGVAAGAFGYGQIPFGDYLRRNPRPLNRMTGTATFEGPATGLYSNSNDGVIDYFDGMVNLTADFGAPKFDENGALMDDDEAGTIRGVVSIDTIGGAPRDGGSLLISLHPTNLFIAEHHSLNQPRDNTPEGSPHLWQDAGQPGYVPHEHSSAARFTGRATVGTAMAGPLELPYSGRWQGGFFGPIFDTTGLSEADRIAGQAAHRPTSAAGAFGVQGGGDQAGISYIGAYGAHLQPQP